MSSLGPLEDHDRFFAGGLLFREEIAEDVIDTLLSRGDVVTIPVACEDQGNDFVGAALTADLA